MDYDRRGKTAFDPSILGITPEELAEMDDEEQHEALWESLNRAADIAQHTANAFKGVLPSSERSQVMQAFRILRDVARKTRSFTAREGEIASNPAIEAMGAHLDGDDEPSKHIPNLSPAAERFDGGGPKKNPFGPQNGLPERGGRPPWGDDESKPAQKSIPGEKR